MDKIEAAIKKIARKQYRIAITSGISVDYDELISIGFLVYLENKEKHFKVLVKTIYHNIRKHIYKDKKTSGRTDMIECKNSLESALFVNEWFCKSGKTTKEIVEFVLSKDKEYKSITKTRKDVRNILKKKYGTRTGRLSYQIMSDSFKKMVPCEL